MFNVTQSEIEALVQACDYSEALSITAGEHDVKEACAVAKRFGFRAVVAFPQFLGLIVDELTDSGVLAQIPVAFPCGGTTTVVKCKEAEQGLNRGASDLDMVMNISAFKNGDYKKVSEDICAVRRVAEPFNVPFKVIIEIGVLTDEEIVTAAKIVSDCGAGFIKTCTGFGPGRATVRAISMIRSNISDSMGIKASGGVAGLEDGVAFMRAGATVVAQRSVFVDQLKKIGFETQTN